jgi:outer membrane receptor protein involved in Fe transport
MRTQFTPRLNLRYDPAADWHVYGSWGEFSQSQRVDEFRAEENQSTPDPANRAAHSVVGLAHEPGDALRWRIEMYRDHWSSVSPYYDNSLGVVTLLPELQPDRIRIAPLGAESDGLELSARQSLSPMLTVSGTYTLSKALDELPLGDVPRSWDQRHAANLGLAWQSPRTTVSLLVGWHSGWPRTAINLMPAAPGTAAYLQAGAQNALRWGTYLSLDAHLAERLDTRLGEFSVWLDIANATNRGNECCAELAPVTGSAPSWSTDSWPGRILDLGFSWRLQGGH